VNGAPPFTVTWSVSYSDPSIHASYSTATGTSLDLAVPAGRYAITIRATPRESVYGRTGAVSEARIAVCTDAGGGEIMAGSLSVPTTGTRVAAEAGAC
jgi:hypothetical protein